jgi:hypothetical protein
MSASPFVFDLTKAMRQDARLRHRVTESARTCDNIQHLAREGKATPRDLHAAQAALVEACGFNYGMLIPKMFPRYPEDKPLDLAARPFMFVLTSMAEDCSVTVEAGRQVGKCAVGETVVETNKGAMTLRGIFDSGASRRKSALTDA